MAITPNPPADFTPTQGNYRELKPFRYWCQKVLPLVYDDSLSYYELLCKVVDYLNKTMEDVDTLHTDVDNLHTAYVQLQAYVNNYFSTLDVQEEINKKLDVMASNGSLSALVAPYVPPAVNNKVNSMVSSGEFADIVEPFVEPAVDEEIGDMVSDGRFKAITDPKVIQATDVWLAQHITNPSNPPLDSSLTLENAAAQSKAVGDNFLECIKATRDVVSSTELPDADNAKVNSIYGIYNPSSPDIAHLPNQIGTLITARYQKTSGNFHIQLFIDQYNKFYYRIMMANHWLTWNEVVDLTILPKLIQCVATTVFDYTTLPDANNAPVNRILAIFNQETDNIAHLPDQAGTLMTTQYNNENGNFGVQVFVDRYGKLYQRIKLNNTWGNWYKNATADMIESAVLGNYELIDYSVIQDANDLTVNRIYAILNSDTNIAHLPSQAGILICERYRQEAGNFTYQKFIDANGECYVRALYGTGWTNWKKQLNETDLNLIIKTPSRLTYDYNTLTDADNAPINTVIALYNTESSDIAHIPDQIGTLFTTQYRGENGNFAIQIFIDRYNRLHHRIKLDNAWGTWNKETISSEVESAVKGNYDIIDYSVVQDANNLTVNRIYAILNSGTNIAHLPSQAGILICERYRQEAGNFTYQKFIDANGVSYIRALYGSGWTDWKKQLNETDLNMIFHSPSTTPRDYNTLSDANNAPINTILAIYNDTGTDIAHLPDQIGTLITTQYGASGGNFTIQFFIDRYNKVYHRQKLPSWTAWEREAIKKGFNFYGKKIILGGDSVTHGVGGTGFAQDGDLIISTTDRSWYRNPNGYCWANLFENLLETKYGATVINNACTGTNSNFWNAYKSTLIPTDADYLILTIGANDRELSSMQVIHDTILSSLDGIKKYCDTNGITLLMFSPITATLANESERTAQMWQINEFIKEACDKFNIEYFDLQNECYKFYFNKGEAIGTYYDTSHPNDEMYYNMFYFYCWLLDICPSLPVLTPPT